MMDVGKCRSFQRILNLDNDVMCVPFEFMQMKSKCKERRTKYSIKIIYQNALYVYEFVPVVSIHQVDVHISDIDRI